MKSTLYILIFFLFASIVSQEAMAQGCVAVRSMGGNIMCNTSSYSLHKGEFIIGADYRYFHSFRHFVGAQEQTYRQTTGGGFDENGHEKGNAVNIYSHAVNLNISYALSNRIQFNVSIPYVNNERSQVLVTKKDPTTNQALEGTRYSLYAQGLGDIRMSANYWIYDPSVAHKGNISVGLGVKWNTGRHDTKDNVPQADGTTKLSVNDQAIQPGDGGIGFSLEVQAFRQLYKGIYGFANGYYLFNPRESNGSYKSAPSVVKDGSGASHTLYGYNTFASPDQYFARVGIMGSILKSKALTLSLAGRWEGIPAYDAFGGQAAFRRPGYVIAVESGVSYREGKHTISLFVPYNFIKNRVQSSADIATQNIENSNLSDGMPKKRENGDAAFADYSINVVYSYRLGKIF